MKRQLQQLAALLILGAGIVAWALLTGAMANDLIKPVPYLIWVAVIGIVTYCDAGWINRHFVGGEWI